MLTDLRLGFRLLARRPSLALTAIVSLSLGIGANTAIFSVLHSVILNPLPYANPDELVIVWETRADNPERWVAPANFVDWRRDSRSFRALAAFDEFAPTLFGIGEPERLRALGVSGTFFTTLGVRAAFGRTLLSSDDEPDADSVAVLSYGLWSRLFGAAPDALGRALELDGRPYIVVGVMPAEFESPLQSNIDVWLSGDRGVPRTFPFGGDLTSVRDSHIIFVVGRLAPGATRDTAQAELSAMMVELARRFPTTNTGLGVNVKPLHEAVVGDVRGLVLLLQLAVSIMLLIACANVAHLLLGQATVRFGEIATRAALGAGRARLVRQLLAETLVIALPGGLLGLLLAMWSHDALVVGELALAQILLVGAGLLLASFVATQHVPLGFETDGRVAADLNLAPARYLTPVTPGEFTIDPRRKLQFVEAVLDELRASPNVRNAGASFTSPLMGAPNRGMSIEGRPRKGPGLEDAADFQLVTPDFFRAVGATLVRGRALTAEDRANGPRVAVVNQAFASKYFQGEDPIGRRIQFGGDLTHEIVGIVGDMRYRRLESPADPTFYIPITQNAERWPFLSFTIWTEGDTASAATLLRGAIRKADPNQAITRVRSYDEILGTALAPRRFNTLLVTVFACTALLLAAVGTYGVIAYAVSTRTRELGVRVALGAGPRQLLRMVIGQGARLTGMAVLAGVAGGWMLTGFMSAMLYEVKPHDSATFIAVALLLTTVALVATWFPARRAIRVNPLNALRDQ